MSSGKCFTIFSGMLSYCLCIKQMKCLSPRMKNSSYYCYNVCFVKKYEQLFMISNFINSFPPYSCGNVTFSILTPGPNQRPGYNNFYNTPSLQEFVKATQVRLHFHGQYHTTETPVSPRHRYYGVNEITITGRQAHDQGSECAFHDESRVQQILSYSFKNTLAFKRNPDSSLHVLTLFPILRFWGEICMWVFDVHNITLLGNQFSKAVGFRSYDTLSPTQKRIVKYFAYFFLEYNFQVFLKSKRRSQICSYNCSPSQSVSTELDLHKFTVL